MRRAENRRLRFHLKINTGMNRLGILPSELDAFASALADSPPHRARRHVHAFRVGGGFQRAPDRRAGRNISDSASSACARSEFRRESCTWPIAARFARGRARGRTWCVPARFSTATISRSIRRTKARRFSDRLPVEPSLSLRARIITLRDLPAGQPVGYGARFVTQQPSRIAVINAGYADGILRQRTNRGCALLRGRRVPLVGTISMDLTTLDVTERSGCEARRRGDALRPRRRRRNQSIGRGRGDRHGHFGSSLRARPPRPALLRVTARFTALTASALTPRFVHSAILACYTGF